jgi:transposase
MIIDLQTLPSDTAILHKIIGDLVAANSDLVTRNDNLIIKNDDLLSENEVLKEQLALLRAKHFGKSSEKIERQIEELELRIEENESRVSMGAYDEKNDKQLEKQKPKRKKLPDHLPRIEVILDPPSSCPSCGGEKFRKISDDISETLEYIPASFKVKQYIRPRCACVNCENIVQAYAPSKAIDKGKAGAGLLAHILVQKYCNHLPLYRQSQIYEREGIELSRSTMAGWVSQCARLLSPIVEGIRSSIFASDQIHGDDTPVKVLAPGLGKTKTGRLWTYVRDGRPHGNTTPPAVCYFYSPDRKGERPVEHLKDFKGILHADAYSGYNDLYNEDKDLGIKITEAACWAHTRRKFYEITVANDKASIAITVLDEISQIYKIESEIKGLKPEKRLEHRQKRSRALVEKLFIDMKKFAGMLPKKSSTAKAIAYAMNNQTALMRFLDNGSIEIDNNAAERSMRSIALGRKNWLFAGSDHGGHAAAAIYTLTETAKLNNLNPWKYLQHVLEQIQDYNSSKISELLPWNINLK